MDDNSGGGFFGLGGGNFLSNPSVLAGLQILGNTTPKIGAIPNPLEGVPTTLMSAQDRVRKAQQQALENQLAEQKRQGEQDALTKALIYGGVPEADARTYSKSLPAINLYQGYQEQQKADKENQRYFNTPEPGAAPQQPQQTPAQPAPYAPAPQSSIPSGGGSPGAAPQNSLADVSSKFDAFGQSSVGKTVAQVAAQSGNQTTAAKFLNAARNQGMSPDSQITGPILSNPITAMPLAKALGIGADLPDDQWQQAHAEAFQASRARQAARAAEQQAPAQQAAPEQQAAGQQAPVPQQVAEQQAQPTQQSGPIIPFTQTGASPAMAPAPQQAQPQQQAPESNATERALAVREQKRVADLNAKIAYNERFLKSKDPTVAAAAAERIQAYRQELAQKPQFTTIGKDMYGAEIKGFVHPDGTVTPYEPPGRKDQAATMSEPLPGDTVDERLQSIPAETRPTVKAMLEGRQAPPSSFAMKTEYWQRLINMANRVDPEFDQTKWASRVATRKDFDQGKTAQNLISMGQLYGHFDKLTDSIDKLDNSDFPTVNTIRNKALSLAGSDKATNVTTAAKAVAAEVARVFKVVGVTGEKETKEWEKLIDPSMSPEQLKGSVRTLLDLVDSRVQEQGARWNAQFPDHPRRLYSPNAEKKLEQVRAWSESGAPGTAPKSSGAGHGPAPGNYTYDPNTRQMVPQQ